MAGDLREDLHDLLMKLLHYACHVQEPILLRLQGRLCLLQCPFCSLLQLLQMLPQCHHEPLTLTCILR